MKTSLKQSYLGMQSAAGTIKTQGSPAGILPAMELDAFLRLFPWPVDLSGKGTPIEFLWHWNLRISQENLWSYASDTSRLNRTVGYPEIKISEIAGELHGSHLLSGMPQEWIELPWEWKYPDYFIGVRKYTKGIAAAMRGIFHFQSLGEKTRIYIYIGWIPRGAMGTRIINAVFPLYRNGYEKALREIENIHIEKPLFARPTNFEFSQEAIRRIKALGAELVMLGYSAFIYSRFMEYLRTADEQELDRIQIRILARTLSVQESILARICLHATRAGLLTFSWDLICPHCRGVRAKFDSLCQVPKNGTCEICQIDFETNRENSIEVTFHVHPSIRETTVHFFCSAEPAKKNHIKIQKNLAPGEKLSLPCAFQNGRYRLRIRGRHSYNSLEIVEHATTDDVHWNSEVDAQSISRTSGFNLILENPTVSAQTFILEDLEWQNDSLQPLHLFAFLNDAAKEGLLTSVERQGGLIHYFSQKNNLSEITQNGA
jgi:hypothetical protein